MMKQKDWILVIVMSFIGAVLSFFVSNFLFATPHKGKNTAEVVDSITANFPVPPATYFNPSAINPAQPVQIGNSTNPNPFNTKSQ